MRMYLSGLESAEEASMVERAGAHHLLLDIHQYQTISPAHGLVTFFLDSGAYRAFKQNKVGNCESYLDWIELHHDLFHHITAMDVIGDPTHTMKNWRTYFRGESQKLVPVWQRGASRSDLDVYLHDAPVVGIGGMAKTLRGGHREPNPERKRQLDAERDRAIEQLVKLCEEFPNRFHIFGICSLAAINQLQGLAASGDTSKWLDGGRYAYAIFRNTRTGLLSQAPARSIPGWQDLDREHLCIACADEMYHFGHPTHHRRQRRLEES